MTTSAAKHIADRYIARDGGEPASEQQPARTIPGAAWRDYNETVLAVLTKKSIAKTEDGRLALWAFERIGDAKAEGEKMARGKR